MSDSTQKAKTLGERLNEAERSKAAAAREERIATAETRKKEITDAVEQALSNQQTDDIVVWRFSDAELRSIIARYDGFQLLYQRRYGQRVRPSDFEFSPVRAAMEWGEETQELIFSIRHPMNAQAHEICVRQKKPEDNDVR